MKGFTLIELLVVVLIIGILAAVALPQYRRAVEKTRLTEVLLTMNTLGKALDRYVLKNGKPTANMGYEKTLDKLDINFPTRVGARINVHKYIIFSNLSNSFGGWWIHVDHAEYGGAILRMQGDGNNTCSIKRTEDKIWIALCNDLIDTQGFAVGG